MWEIFGVLNLTLHHTGTDGKMPLLILRTDWAEAYFALCEAAVLVLVLVCDSAAKTDLDIYLGLDYYGLWSMTRLDSRLRCPLVYIYISTIVRAKCCQQRPSHRPWDPPPPRARPPPPSPSSPGCRDMNCEVSSPRHSSVQFVDSLF